MEAGGWKTLGARSLCGLRSFSKMVVRINPEPEKSDWPPSVRLERRASLGSGVVRQGIGFPPINPDSVGLGSVGPLGPSFFAPARPGFTRIRLDLPGLGTIGRGLATGVVALTFWSAGGRDFPVPCSRAGRFPARFSAHRNWRLESRQHPPTGMSTPQPTTATQGGAFGDWPLASAHGMAWFAHTPPILPPPWDR